MNKFTLICDYCGKEVELNTSCFSIRDLPSDWVALAYHKGSFLAFDDWRILYHFCSAECLDKAVRRIENENRKS